MFVYCKDDKNSFNPLVFWPAHKEKFSIMARLCEVLLPIPATSGDVERIFSRGGIICTPRRNRLKQDTIQKLVFLHQAYLEDELFNSRQRKTMKDFDEFMKCLNDEEAWDEYFFFLTDVLELTYFSDDDADEDEINDDDYMDSIESLASHDG